MKTPLQQVRESNALTIQQVADAVGCSNASYCRIEQGLQMPRKNLLNTIINFFNKKISEAEILYPERFLSQTPPNKKPQ